MEDIFRPRNNPARAIYDAFQAEAEKREERTVPEWIEAERNVVWDAAKKAAEEYGWTPPTLQNVIDAETYAMGSIDYGSKLAYRIIQLMQGETQR